MDRETAKHRFSHHRDGVSVSDRKYHGRTYKNCFIGSEAVSWIVENVEDVKSRDEALKLGNEWQEAGEFDHVTGDHVLKDDKLFYHFSDSQFDMVVIGAGPGGITAAVFAAQLGKRVCLVERSAIGGDCTWTGCVPSKALIKVSKMAQNARDMHKFGLNVGALNVDMGAVKEYIKAAVDEIAEEENEDHLTRAGVTVKFGTAKFVTRNKIIINGEGIPGVVTSKYFLICTGAVPVMPKVKGLQDVDFMSYENIFQNERLPNRLTVIGAGPIGIELGQAYQRLGAEVTLVGRTLLPRADSLVRETLLEVFQREGLQHVKGYATSISCDQDGNYKVKTDTKKTIESDMVLIAAGRKPVVKGLGLDDIGVKYSDKGIIVDDNLRTNAKNIFAAGDVTGGPQFTHYAGWQAFIAVRNAFILGSSKGHTDLIPTVTFSEPEVAQLGLTEEEALKEEPKNPPSILFWKNDKIDRAICENDRAGFIKIVHRDSKIIGVTIVSERAGEQILEFVVAMQNGLGLDKIANSLHPYPTYGTTSQQLAASQVVAALTTKAGGRVVLNLSKLMR